MLVACTLLASPSASHSARTRCSISIPSDEIRRKALSCIRGIGPGYGRMLFFSIFLKPDYFIFDWFWHVCGQPDRGSRNGEERITKRVTKSLPRGFLQSEEPSQDSTVDLDDFDHFPQARGEVECHRKANNDCSSSGPLKFTLLREQGSRHRSRSRLCSR